MVKHISTRTIPPAEPERRIQVEFTEDELALITNLLMNFSYSDRRLLGGGGSPAKLGPKWFNLSHNVFTELKEFSRQDQYWEDVL